MIADPEDGNAAIARNLLLDRVMARAQDLKAALSSRPVRLAADMMTSQRADIEYLSSQGFQAYAAVVVMQRSTVEPAPEVRLPPPLSVRPGKIDSEEDQLAYLRAFNICFPDMPKTLEALRYSLRLPQWAGGIALAALTPQGELAGSVLAYADEARGCGVIDDVFVLPEWRGRGIAKSLIGQGLDTLRAHDVADVRLEVKAGNQPAVAAYRAMGFRIVNEEVLMGRWI